MGIRIANYRPEDEPRARAFNARLRAGGIADFKLPEHWQSRWLPAVDGSPLHEEYFLADDAEQVRGGYILKHQLFQLPDREASVGYLYSPVSEALVDARFGAVGLQLLLHAQRRQPLLYCLGMGGMENPLPKMLRAAGWQLCPVPFLFRVVEARTFFQNIAILRRPAWRRWLLDALALSGAGGLGVFGIQWARQRRPAFQGTFQWVEVPEFDAQVDAIWAEARDTSAFAAVRDAATLRRLYPASQSKYLRLLLVCAGKPVGWAVAMDSQLSHHKHFGAMRLGSVIDALALPGWEAATAWAAGACLRGRGVDLMITNQAHAQWELAFRQAGWLAGPSNFIFAASPALARAMGGLAAARPRLHLTRGDGEGPTHL